MKLLSPANSNAKTAKNDANNYISAILHLAPYNLSGVNVCPHASAGCAKACLNTAGRGAFNNVQQARIKKTQLFLKQRAEFFKLLIKDLEYLQRKALKEGKKAVVRLNGTSDLSFESIKVLETGKNIFDLYPNIQFYDYTKNINRVKRQHVTPIANYYLVFSRAENNEEACIEALKLGFNVAAVFKKQLPISYLSSPVVSGENTDLRFLDNVKGQIIGLIAKGKAKKDVSGFVI